jgi:hypothetical protein
MREKWNQTIGKLEKWKNGKMESQHYNFPVFHYSNDIY